MSDLQEATDEFEDRSNTVRSRWASYRMPSRSRLAVALAWPAFIYLCGFSLLRSFDVAPVVLVLLSSGAASVLAGHIAVNRTYVAYAGWATLLMALSLMHLMPRGWTVHFETFAAMRHYVVYLALPFLISSYLILIQRYEKVVLRHPLAVLLAIVALTRISILLGTYEGLTLTLYIFSNENAIVAMFFCILLFRHWRPLINDVAMILIFLVFCTSLQSQIFVLALLALRVSRAPRLVFISFFAALSIFVIIAPFAVQTLHAIDHNTGVRALLWNHALELVWQTGGLGVGFGTEYIKNDFSEIMYPGWTFVAAGDELYVGTHSAYYDILLRTGVVGLGLMLMWFLPALRVSGRASLPERRLGFAIATILCITVSVDMALTSLNYFFACTFGFALLRRLRTGPLSVGQHD